jgi:hypothetical protein
MSIRPENHVVLSALISLVVERRGRLFGQGYRYLRDAIPIFRIPGLDEIPAIFFGGNLHGWVTADKIWGFGLCA